MTLKRVEITVFLASVVVTPAATNLCAESLRHDRQAGDTFPMTVANLFAAWSAAKIPSNAVVFN
jgi:hypothetical protein